MYGFSLVTHHHLETVMTSVFFGSIASQTVRDGVIVMSIFRNFALHTGHDVQQRLKVLFKVLLIGKQHCFFFYHHLKNCRWYTVCFWRSNYDPTGDRMPNNNFTSASLLDMSMWTVCNTDSGDFSHERDELSSLKKKKKTPTKSSHWGILHLQP